MDHARFDPYVGGRVARGALPLVFKRCLRFNSRALGAKLLASFGWILRPIT
jgi:hypothetical protein